MTQRYVTDEDGAVISGECLHNCAPGAPAPCEADDCACACHSEAERAREADDRHPHKLHVIAADMEREARPTSEELMGERFGAVDDETGPTDCPQQAVDALTSKNAKIIAKNHSPYTGQPTSTDDVVRRYAHRLSTGVLAWPALPKHTADGRPA